MDHNFIPQPKISKSDLHIYISILILIPTHTITIKKHFNQPRTTSLIMPISSISQTHDLDEDEKFDSQLTTLEINKTIDKIIVTYEKKEPKENKNIDESIDWIDDDIDIMIAIDVNRVLNKMLQRFDNDKPSETKQSLRSIEKKYGPLKKQPKITELTGRQCITTKKGRF